MTTILLMIIATIGYGIVKSNRTDAGKLYGDYYGTFSGVSDEQIQKMELRSEFTEIGIMAVAGKTEKKGSLCYADKTALDMLNLSTQLKEGTFPKNKSEITASPTFFHSYKIKSPKIGDTIKVSYRTNLSEPYAEDTFVISGILKEEKNDTGANMAFLSRSFYEEKISKEQRSYTAYFKLSQAVDINAENGEKTLKKLAKKCGVDERFASDNYAYLMWALDPGAAMIAFCIVIMFVIVLFSGMVIYNIFQEGITQKIQEYGKVRALGATGKQMKSLIWKEGMLLALPGIPSGLILGYGISVISFSMIIKISNATIQVEREKISLFSVPILLVVGFISFVAVWLALKKPMKLVAGISPVEAMRYQERNLTKGKSNLRKGKKSISTLGLTKANLNGKRKQTIQTICTMGLSCVLFVVMANFAGNMDAEFEARKYIEHGKFEVSLDYSMRDSAYPENNLDQILLNNPMNDDLIQEIKNIKGVTEVKTRPILIIKRYDKQGKELKNYESVEVLSQEDYQWLLVQGGALENTASYQSTAKEDGIIYGWSRFLSDTDTKVNDTIPIKFSSGTEQKELTTKVKGAFGSEDTDWSITESTYQKLGFQNPSTFKIWIDCKKGMEQSVRAQLKQLLSEKEHLEFDSYEDALWVEKNNILMMKTICYSLSVMIAIISFLNMANTLITSVVTRKQEFGMLQAIGMTNKQLNMSLQAEGILFTFGTVIVAMAAGIPFGLGVFYYGKHKAWIGLYKYHLPIKELLLMIAFLAVFQIILSCILTRSQKKDSLIERIRYQG